MTKIKGDLRYTQDFSKLTAKASAVSTDLIPVQVTGGGGTLTLTLAKIATLIESGGLTSATPSLDLIDSDTTDGDVSATIAANATATGTGAEDVDILYRTQIGGTMTTHMSFDADDGSGALALQTISGGKLGFFAVTPVVRASALTQTLATADGTHAARTAATLTDNSGGEAADGTIAEITDIALSTSDTYTDAAVNTAVNAVVDDTGNAITELSDQINKLIVDQLDTATFLNQVVDDLQAYGILQ